MHKSSLIDRAPKIFVMAIHAVLALVVLVVWAPDAIADRIILKSGQVFNGIILSETDTELIVELHEDGVEGNITISKSDVQSIESGEAPVAQSPIEEYVKREAETPKDNVDAQFSLGQWCWDKGLDDEARHHFGKTIELNPDHAGARAVLGYKRIDGVWKKQSETEGRPKRRTLTEEEWQAFEDVFQKAILSFLNQQYVQAVEHFEQALMINPRSKEGQLHLANSYFKAQQWNKAHDQFEKILPDHPKDNALRRNFAKILIHLERPVEAAAALSALLEIDERDYEALAALGYIHYTSGEYEKALEAYTRCKDVVEDGILLFAYEARRGMGMSFARVKLFSASFKEFKAILKRDPLDTTAIYVYARARYDHYLHSKDDKPKDAHKSLKKALDLFRRYVKYEGEDGEFIEEAKAQIAIIETLLGE